MCPNSISSFVENTEFPMGLGEPPLIAVPPAIGNAVFRGQRCQGSRPADTRLTPGEMFAGLR